MSLDLAEMNLPSQKSPETKERQTGCNQHLKLSCIKEYHGTNSNL